MGQWRRPRRATASALVTCLLLATWSSAAESDCERALAADDAWATSLSPKHLGELVRRGDLDCAARAASTVDAKGAATLVSEADMALRGAEQAAAKVRAALFEGTTTTTAGLPAEAKTVTPAFEWAQSATHALLRIKWAHKIDAPATLDVGAPRVVATNASVTLVGGSRSKGFRYQLDLVPFADVVPGQCAFEPGAVGRGTLSLKKRVKAKWPRLLSDEAAGARLPMHTWWDKQEEYREELAALGDAGEAADKDDDAKQAGKVGKKPSSRVEVDAPRGGGDDDDDGAPPPSLGGKPSPLRRFLAAARTKLSPTSVLKIDDLRRTAENFADGWRGDVKDFAARQVDRALDRAKRNATAHLDALDAEEKARKKVVTDETKAAIADVERQLNATAANASSGSGEL